MQTCHQGSFQLFLVCQIDSGKINSGKVVTGISLFPAIEHAFCLTACPGFYVLFAVMYLPLHL